MSARRIAPRAPAGAREIDGLDVLLVGPHDADMGKRERDDLPGVGGIGEDFLITRHRRVEADFADGLADGADAETFDDEPIGQHDQRGRQARRPTGRRSNGVASVRVAFDMGVWLSAARVGRQAGRESPKWRKRFPCATQSPRR